MEWPDPALKVRDRARFAHSTACSPRLCDELTTRPSGLPLPISFRSLSPILAATFMPPRGRPTLVVLSRLKKERKKTDNPREGWEDGTPPPHRDFKDRSVVLAVAHPIPWSSASFYLPSQSLADSRCNLHATSRSSHSRRSLPCHFLLCRVVLFCLVL